MAQLTQCLVQFLDGKTSQCILGSHTYQFMHGNPVPSNGQFFFSFHITCVHFMPAKGFTAFGHDVRQENMQLR